MRVFSRPLIGRMLFSPDENPGSAPPAGAPAPAAGDPPAPAPTPKPASLMGAADDKPAGEPGAPPAGAQPAAGDPPQDQSTPAAPAVPEKYELQLPENSPLDASAIERTSAFAREQKLSQEQATKVLEHLNSEVASREAAYLESIRPGGAEWIAKTTQWQNDGIADPEIGGTLDNLKKSASEAKAVVQKFFPPEILTFLDETGFGSHPGVIKGFVKFARAVSEGSAPQRDPALPVETKSTGLYPNLPSEKDRR